MNDMPLPEPLDEFLQHPPSLPADAARRESLFQQTAALAPRQRRRRWPIAVAAAACVTIALCATWYFLGDQIVAPMPKKDLVERKQDSAPEQPKPKLESPPVVSTPDPRELEWTAFDAESDRKRVQLYFQAGDLYLTAHNDIDSAVRCYHQALHYCDGRELEFNSNDNWLVMALKRDRRKEP